jgi:hypothetical protein
VTLAGKVFGRERTVVAVRRFSGFRSSWDHGLCAAYVGAVDRSRIGDDVVRPLTDPRRLGQPLAARTKDGLLGSMRVHSRTSCQPGLIEHEDTDPDGTIDTAAARSVRVAAGPGWFQGQLAYPRTVAPARCRRSPSGAAPAAGDGSAVTAEPPSVRCV